MPTPNQPTRIPTPETVMQHLKDRTAAAIESTESAKPWSDDLPSHPFTQWCQRRQIDDPAAYLKERSAEYFAKSNEEKTIPSLSGLTLYLGFATQVNLNHWIVRKNIQPVWIEILARLKAVHKSTVSTA